MKKWAPFILTGAVLAYFLIFKKKPAAPGQIVGSANQADNFKRAAPAKAPKDNSVLTSGIGAAAGLLKAILPLLGGKGSGGGGTSGGGSGGLGLPTGGGGKPGSNQSSSGGRGNSIRPYDPTDPGGELMPGGTLSQGGSLSSPLEEQTGANADFGGELGLGSGLTPLNAIDYPSGTQRDLSGLTNADLYNAYDSESFLWAPNYNLFGETTNPETPTQQYLPSNFAGWDPASLDLSVGSAQSITFLNPTFSTADYTSGTELDSSLLQVPDYSTGEYVDPFLAYSDISDPFDQFFDFNNFDYPSGGNYSYDTGGGEEKRASVTAPGGGGGGGGNTYVPNTGGGYTLNPPPIPGFKY